MRLSDAVFHEIQAWEADFPPWVLVRAIHTLCEELHEPYDEVSHSAISAFFYGVVVKRLPPAFITTKRDFYLDFEKWDANPSAYERSPTVPLYDILPMGTIIDNIHAQFLSRFYKFTGLIELRQQLKKNEAMAHGLSAYQLLKTRVPLPSEMDEEPYKLIEKFLHHTPFYNFFCTEVPFRIPRDRWPSHAIAIAPSEWGKSELIGTFLREAIEDPKPRGIILCDPHGDLYNKAVTRVPPKRLIAIDLKKNAPDLNILDRSVMSERSALDTFRFLCSSLAGGLSPKQEQAIKPLFGLLNKIDGANLFTLHEIITEQVKKPTKFKDQISQLDPLHRTFFETLWYSGNYSETKDALQWKLSAALDDPTFKKMFSAPGNSINVSRWIEERKVVLIKSSDQLDKEGTRLFFLYLVGQFYAAAMRRDAMPEKDRHLAMMFFDEASVVLQSPIIADILTGIRKYNCSFMAATQLWHHVAMEVRPAVLGSCGIRILGQLGHDEASALYRDQKVPLDTITSLRNVPRSHAQWCFFVRSVTEEGIVVKTPYGALEALPTVAEIKEADQVLDDIAHTIGDIVPQKQRGGTETAPPPPEPTDASAGIHKSSATLPQPPEIDTYRLVATTSSRIEKLLVTKFKAYGPGLGEKLNSVADKINLSEDLSEAKTWLLGIRNRQIHSAGDFELNAPAKTKFVRLAKLLEDHLINTPTDPAEPGALKQQQNELSLRDVGLPLPPTTPSTDGPSKPAKGRL